MKDKILYFIVLLFFTNCGYIEIKNKNFIKPYFDNQRSLIIKQNIISFNTIFNVYENEEENKNSPLFKIISKNNMFNNIFEIKDLINNNTLILEITNDKHNTIFYIKDKNYNIISIIKNIYLKDFLNFEFNYNNKYYILSGEEKNINQNSIYSINYKIIEESNKNKNLCYIYKQFHYMKNEYDLIINKNFNELPDDFLVVLTIFIDIMLKNNGFFYRN